MGNEVSYIMYEIYLVGEIGEGDQYSDVNLI